jgi:predicted amidohydrolase
VTSIGARRESGTAWGIVVLAEPDNPLAWSTASSIFCRQFEQQDIFAPALWTAVTPLAAGLPEAARRAQIAVAITCLQRWPGAPRNAATVIDRHRRDVLTYAKVHTCDWVFERWLTPGETFPVASRGRVGLDVRLIGTRG